MADGCRLLLMGPRASGKTTVGRALAARCGVPFIDLDEVVRARFVEPTIHEIWARHGEAGWRDVEAACLREVLDGPAGVVALGGGTPMIEDVRRTIRAARDARRCVVVYLRCPVPLLRRRLGAVPGDRPPLVGADAVSEVADVLARREPVYLDLADVVVDGSAPAAEIAADLEARALIRSRSGDVPDDACG
ncbi:MAG: shikimate kinase [Planctomycetota bacterium]|jgi:shikimate kinase